MKKLPTKNDDGNPLVNVVVRVSDGNVYECVGVLMEENGDSIEVAFNAVNKKVMDSLVFKKTDILSINILDPLTIEELT
ncbi:MAG: hypothetical protein WC724_01310 [Candidatus Paceibacterota bacterium]|jgi:hypothetical protein